MTSHLRNSLLLIAVILAIAAPLRAQEILARADFEGGDIAPLKQNHPTSPTPVMKVIEVSNAPEGVGTHVLHLDDSEAEEGKGSYGLTLYFPSVSDGILEATAIIRIPEEGLLGINESLDIRISFGGRSGDDYPSASYLRIRRSGEKIIWSVYDPRNGKHRGINFVADPGQWCRIVQRLDLKNRTYDWSVEGLGGQGELGKVSGQNELFYQSVETLSYLSFVSIARGGAIEIAEVSVEVPE